MPDPYTGPHADTAALILIDVQRDFFEEDAPARIEGTSEAIPAMAELASAFRAKGLPIVHVVRLYLPDGSNADMVRRHAIENGARVVRPGSPGAQVAPELLPAKAELDDEILLKGGFQAVGPREHIMYKPRWGAFYGTALEGHLRDAGADTLVFAGCNFPNCPRTSVYEASERDFRAVLVADAMSGVYDRGAAECRRIGVPVWNVAETVKWLEAV
ncbi:cysteine hydrolase family protein [Actinomadura rubrisoli]|uniref:cysteine hydrolase family protein n=1 Tax=Actinomadura rubrisoli TaxID=2530368 RepID=UPI001A9ED135|nr:isochorismatase family cysteine hydrolase [Actinomadura rubrisoli]